MTDLKWSDLYHSGDVTFFMIKNKKVERNHNINGEFYKYVPLKSDLYDLLVELGYDKM